MLRAARRPQPRSTARIDANLENKLAAYMAVAGAAGVSLLAAQPAEGRIVYTAANTAVTQATQIDLNHDGIADFTLAFHGLDKSVILTVAPNGKGNAIEVGGGGAGAGMFGAPVSAGQAFASNTIYSWGVLMADAGSYSRSWFFGPWANAKNRFLGLKFVVNGKIHFGWARLTVGDYIHPGNEVVLTGYAYETIPGKPILEGHTNDWASSVAPADLLAPVAQPASLGMLARGADGLALWRRDEES